MKKTSLLEMKAKRYATLYPEVAALSPAEAARITRKIAIVESAIKSYHKSKSLTSLREGAEVNNLGTIPAFLVASIVANYAENPIKYFAGVQDLQSPQGLIRYRGVKLVAQSDAQKESAAVGAILHDALGTDLLDINLGNGHVKVSVANADVADYTLPSGVHVLGETLKIYNADKSVYAVGKADGDIIGKGISGTFKFAANVTTFELVTTSTDDFIFEFAYDLGAFDNVSTVETTTEVKAVTAHEKVIRGISSLFKILVANKTFGEDEIEQLKNDLKIEMSKVICGEAVAAISTAAQALADFDYSTLNSTIYESKIREAQDNVVKKLDQAIYASSRRMKAGAYICGMNVGTSLITLFPDFKEASTTNVQGPCMIGTLKGRPVVMIPETEVMDADTIIGVGKINEYDAAFIMGEYLPVMSTDLIPLNINNPTGNQLALYSMCSLDVVNEKALAKIKITNYEVL